MPRRQQKTISAKELAIHDDLIAELSGNSAFTGFDMDTVTLTIKKTKAPPRIKDIDRAIINIKYYSAANKDFITTHEGEQIIDKQQLSRILKISRPTLDKWIQDGFIHPVRLKLLPILSFPLDAVLEQLEKQKNKK
jgi:predicted DNA-binding transcriptional regulator AlpA